jgi:serine phosphatase RsbU (regulator of sigma subunit)
VLAIEVSQRPLSSDPLHQPDLEAPFVRFAVRQHPLAPLSGDFFEVVDHGNGKVSALIADVSGNGAPAASLGERVRREARRRTVAGATPSAVLGGTNGWLERQGLFDRFVCSTAVRIDRRLGEAVFASAGHFLPLLKVRPGHAVMLNGPAGPPLGVVADQIFPSTAFRLSLGDILVLVTDGISDALAGPSDPLGERGLAQLVARGPLDLEELCEVVFQATSASVGADAMVLALQMERSPRTPKGNAMGLAWPPANHQRPRVYATTGAHAGCAGGAASA